MITLIDVFNAVSRILADAFPDRYVYIGQEPDQFTRPSFLLELVTTDTSRKGIGFSETIIYLTLTIFEPLDVSRDGDQLLALQDLQTVLSLFAQEQLPIDGRVLPITASNGGQNQGESYAELTVTLREGVGYEPDKDAAEMKSITPRVSLREEGKAI